MLGRPPECQDEPQDESLVTWVATVPLPLTGVILRFGFLIHIPHARHNPGTELNAEWKREYKTALTELTSSTRNEALKDVCAKSVITVVMGAGGKAGGSLSL